MRTIPALDGVRRVYFTDDNLFPGPKRAKEMLRALISAKLGLRWRGLIRASIIDDEVAALMAESGCTEVLLGIESGDAGMLKRMKKLITPAKILQGLETLTRHGISTKSTFIVGFPGETDESLANTVSLLNAYPTGGEAIHRYMFFTYAVLPLSEAAQPAFRAEYDLRGYGYHWQHKTMDSAQAAAKLESLQEQLKPELVPSYVLEVPELPGYSTRQLKRVCQLRNELVQVRRAGGDETALWGEMAESFACR
jgi:p-methyltransferase